MDDGDEAAAAEEADQEEAAAAAAAEPAAAQLPVAAAAGVPERVPARLLPDAVARACEQLAAVATAASSLVQGAEEGAQQAVQAAVRLSPLGPARPPSVSPAARPPGYLPPDRGSVAHRALQALPAHLAAASGSAAAAAAAADGVHEMVAIGEAVEELEELLSTVRRRAQGGMEFVAA